MIEMGTQVIPIYTSNTSTVNIANHLAIIIYNLS